MANYSFLVLLALSAVECSHVSTEYSGTCDAGILTLLPYENGTRPVTCEVGKERIVHILIGCTVDDPAAYVRSSLIFASAYAPGGECENVSHTHSDCAGVPQCYGSVKKVDTDGEYHVDCGRKNEYTNSWENIDSVTECLQEQVNAGCDAVAGKLKTLWRDGGDAICAGQENSSN